MAEKGILSSKMESALAEQLDNLIALKGILEVVDGPAFKIVISTVDNNVADKIPEPYKTEIAEVLNDILEDKDFESASLKAAALVDGLIDIPGLDDATEYEIFVSIFRIVAALLAKVGTEKA